MLVLKIFYEGFEDMVIEDMGYELRSSGKFHQKY